ncbi:UL3 [Human betaherpesvirus 5]|uniref:UL3 n=1 Tax=Human cytomegalovirus TaxID=10359 RepID=A8T755_HCMV|nr:UL3 [Human betaherpesvirus 5]APA46049.1 UL3 [Human betaherpesvirus 5]
MYLQISRDDSSSAERTSGCMTGPVSDTLCLFHSSFIHIQISCDTGIILLGKTLLLSSHWVPYRPLRIPHYPPSRSRTIPNRIRYIPATVGGFYHVRRFGRDPYSQR